MIFLPQLLLLLVLQMLLPAPSSGSPLQSTESLASLSEICQFVRDGNEKIVDAAANDDGDVNGYEEFTTEWIVSLSGGREIADEIAERLGFINNGPITQDGEIFYSFVVKDDEAVLTPFYQPYDKKTEALNAEESVTFAKQETVKVFCANHVPPVTRERRQNEPQNVIIERLSGGRCRVRWTPPANGNPSSYRLNYIGVSISSGSASTSFSLRIMAGTATSYEFTCRHINIIHLFVDRGPLIVEANATLPEAPRNAEVEAVNSTCIRVTWDPPITTGSYTYATILYGSSFLRSSSIGSVTSRVFCGLVAGRTYFVLVLAMVGDEFSGTYRYYNHTVPTTTPPTTRPTTRPPTTRPPTTRPPTTRPPTTAAPTEPQPLVTVRLVDGDHMCEGRVEVYHDGQWGTVCDDSWDLVDANVVCLQVGCGGATSAPHVAHFGQGTGPIWLDGVRCSSDDETLEECDHNGWGIHNCAHYEDAGAVCTDPSTVVPTSSSTPPTTTTPSTTATTSPPMTVTSPTTLATADPTTTATVRLVNGDHWCEGRVEVYHDDQWGTVCDDYWGLVDANVVCRQIGCGQATSAPRNAHFGQGTGPIWLDNVGCSRDDETLQECYHRGWGMHNCRHREDASAVCVYIDPPTIPAPPTESPSSTSVIAVATPSTVAEPQTTTVVSLPTTVAEPQTTTVVSLPTSVAEPQTTTVVSLPSSVAEPQTTTVVSLPAAVPQTTTVVSLPTSVAEPQTTTVVSLPSSVAEPQTTTVVSLPTSVAEPTPSTSSFIEQTTPVPTTTVMMLSSTPAPTVIPSTLPTEVTIDPPTSPTTERLAPRNVTITRAAHSSLTVSWLPPLAGPPTTHYLLNHIFLVNGSGAVSKEKESLIVDVTSESAVFENVKFPAGGLHIFVVSAVSDAVLVSAEVQYLILPSTEVPAPLTVERDSQSSATLSWPPGECLQYLVVYSSVLDDKEGILVTHNTRVDLTDLGNETHIAMVICVSTSDDYIVNAYAPVCFK